MTTIVLTEKERDDGNLLYVKSTLSELFNNSGCGVRFDLNSGRAQLTVSIPEPYAEIIGAEVYDKLAEVIAIKYKYDYFNSSIHLAAMNKTERELLLTGLISADLSDDKKYAYNHLKGERELAVDGAFNFRLIPLKKKWQEIVSYIPATFMGSQLKDFMCFLLENKKKKVYVDGGRVYDSHYRRLKRCSLLGGEGVNVVREVLLSGCGEVELSGKIESDDEHYLKEFYGDRVYFAGAFS